MNFQFLSHSIGVITVNPFSKQVSSAKNWANESDGATAAYFEWQARSQVSTWWPVAPSARQDPTTFTHLPTLDNYANKHWAGLVKHFYAERVRCVIDQASIDLPATPPSPPSPQCPYMPEDRGMYLRNYPPSLPGSNGIQPPATWPYNTTQLAAAQEWCCLHRDCGGVTHQNGKFEVRAGAVPIQNPAGATQASSWPRKNARHSLNTVNLTKCVVTAEMDFTQSTDTNFVTVPSTSDTVTLSHELLAKYGTHYNA